MPTVDRNAPRWTPKPGEGDLVAEWSRLARHIAKSYFLPGSSAADVYQEALVGLLIGIRSFDPSRGVPEKTYYGMAIARWLQAQVKHANTAKTSVLNDAVRETSDRDTDVTLLDLLPSSKTSPDERLETLATARDLARRIRTNLSELEAFALLGYANGLSYDDVVSVVPGIADVKTVDNALQRARLKLVTDSESTRRVYICPGCGCETVKPRRLEGKRGRPPFCNVCKFRKAAA